MIKRLRLALAVSLIGGLMIWACGGEETTTSPGGQQQQVATQLAFTVEPTTTTVASSIMPAVQVAIQGALGNLVAGATDAVTVAIGTNPGGGTLSGTTTVNAVAGVASFTDLTIDQMGTGYTLVATSGSLSSATSATFGIFPPPTPAADAVNVADNSFSPTSLTTSVGTTVQWTWVGGNSHNVTYDDGVGNSVTQTNGTHIRQFTAAGTFPYICTIHGRAVMSGEIVVP